MTVMEVSTFYLNSLLRREIVSTSYTFYPGLVLRLTDVHAVASYTIMFNTAADAAFDGFLACH